MFEGEGPGDGQRRRRPTQEPRESDLRRGGATSFGDIGERSAAGATQGEVRDQRDALAGAVVDDFLVLPFREVVVVLDGSDP